MVLNIEFSIDTNIRRFEEWLDRYRLISLPTILDYKEDKSLSVIGKPTFIGEYQGLRRHEILASISKPDPNKTDAEIHSIPFPVIEFELFEPTENRINVKVISRFKELNDYLIKMLREIARLWPEAKNDIEEGFLPSERIEEIKKQLKLSQEDFGGVWIEENWEVVVNKINTYNKSGLGMVFAGKYDSTSPEDPFGGFARWEIDNADITLYSAGIGGSILTLDTRDQPASNNAARVWERLVTLLKEFEVIQQLHNSNAFYKYERMGEIFNLVLLDTNPQNVMDWISSELPSISPPPIKSGDFEIVMGNTLICPPIQDYPHHKLFVNGIFHKYEEENGKVEISNTFTEAVMCVEIRNITNNSIQVIGLCDDENRLKQSLRELKTIIEGIYEVQYDFPPLATSDSAKEEQIEELFDNYTLEEIMSLENDVTGGRELLFYMAKDLLKEPPDPLTIIVARMALGEVIKPHHEQGVTELDLMREWSTNYLESIPDLSTARAKSKEFIKGSDILPEKYRQIIRQLNNIPIKDAEDLLLSYPLIQKATQDLRKTIDSGASSYTRPLNNKDDKLSQLELGIIDVCNQLQKENATVTDDIISSKLYFRGITNKEGGQYSREWINKKRNSLIDKGYEQCKV